MQLLCVCIALCAAVLSNTDARYSLKGGHMERGLREFRKGPYNPQKTGQIPDRGVVLAAGVVPIMPEDIGEGIVPEVTEAVQFMPQPKTTEKPYFSWNSVWDNVVSAVGDIGNTLGDVASDVGDTVGNWGEEVGDTVGEWSENVGDTVGDWSENVGETVGDWSENVGETVSDWGEKVGNTLYDWGDTLADVADDVKDNVGGAIDDAQVMVQEAQVALVEAAKLAGERLKQSYQDAKEGLPTLRDQVLDSLRRFGILVSDGANYVCKKLIQITDQVRSSAIIQKLQEKLEQGDEKVAEFLQLIGHKMETWFQSHNQLTQHLDVFQDAEIRGELQQLVEHGILTANDVNILIETSRISDKLQKLMEHGDDSVADLIQLLTQKITKWYEENADSISQVNGDSISQVTQQIPSFFQEEDIQEELNKLVEQGILTKSDIKMMMESTSVISKLQDAVMRDDERVMQIFNLMADRRGELEYQQDQRNVEMLPDIFQDDEVQDELQNLVDAGTLTQDDFYIITQQQNQKGHINVEKRWFDSVGDTINNVGEALSETASNVGETLSDTASNVGETVDNWGDTLLDTASNVGETLSDTASNAGETVSDWGNEVAKYADNVADEVVDVAVDVKDAIADAVQKRDFSSVVNPEVRRMLRSWLDSLQQ